MPNSRASLTTQSSPSLAARARRSSDHCSLQGPRHQPVQESAKLQRSQSHQHRSGFDRTSGNKQAPTVGLSVIRKDAGASDWRLRSHLKPELTCEGARHIDTCHLHSATCRWNNNKSSFKRRSREDALVHMTHAQGVNACDCKPQHEAS